MTSSGITIVNYSEQWADTFQLIKRVIEKPLNELIIGIEHVGSTSVKGLGAKPIIDIDIIIESYDVFPKVVLGLEKIGYFHQEESSFTGREAFGRKDVTSPFDGVGTEWMQHHLYVCNKESKELARHLAFRDFLRKNPWAVTEYEHIKRNLADTVADRESYTLGKTEFVNRILRKVTENEKISD